MSALRVYFAFAGSIGLLGLAEPAAALTKQAWVSTAHGSDVAGCGLVASPCLSLQYAADHAVVAGGEIDILDPGDYGPLTIRKALSVVNDGPAALSGGAGATIAINAGSTDAVFLRGLVLDGKRVTSVGIAFSSGGSLVVSNCVVKRFANVGIDIAPTLSATFSIVDTITADNWSTSGGGAGVSVSTPSSGRVSGTIEHLTTVDNLLQNDSPGYGVELVSGGAGSVNVMILNSVAAGNSVGVQAAASSTGTVAAMVRNTAANGNGTGFQTFGAPSAMYLGHVAASGNGAGADNFAGGTIFSYGDNDINGNFADVNGSLTAVAMK